MAARPWWRRISLRYVNIILYLVIAAVSVRYHRELRWAAAELPNYLDNTISASADRQLYRKARDIIRDGGRLRGARELLDESLSIDPYCEGGLWLGHYFFRKGQNEEAVRQFTQYLEIDPLQLEPYLRISSVFERDHRLAEARQILERGLKHFDRSLEQYEPRPDDSVRDKYNRKAVKVYERYRNAASTLRRETRRIAEKER